LLIVTITFAFVLFCFILFHFFVFPGDTSGTLYLQVAIKLFSGAVYDARLNSCFELAVNITLHLLLSFAQNGLSMSDARLNVSLLAIIVNIPLQPPPPLFAETGHPA